MSTVSIRTLVRHGQTPTGFGLALHEVRMFAGQPPKWCLRPLSPCCGTFIEHGATSMDDLHCANCATSWQSFADVCQGTIGNDVPLADDHDTFADVTYSRWYARIMGYPNSEANHGVEVSVSWS